MTNRENVSFTNVVACPLPAEDVYGVLFLAKTRSKLKLQRWMYPKVNAVGFHLQVTVCAVAT